jgi:flagellar M-ring protein FliF
MLQLLSGQTLSDRQVAGILHLVSSSVPNLEPEQVSVVDQRGRLLSRKAVDDGLGYTQEQYRLAQELEQRYSQRIVDIIEPILGPGRVRAQVAADIDFTRVERTSEQYAPETVVRSEQTAEERGSLLDAGGVPGTLANQPPPDAQVQAAPPGNPANPEAPALAAEELQPVSRRVTRNYEMDKTISHVREQPGTLRRLSVAVVVDYIEGEGEDGSAGRVPLAEERLEEIRALVREAVGFDAERGDTVSVINASFAPPPELAPLEEPSFLDAEWPWRVGRGVLAAAALGALIFVVLRPLMKFSAAPVPAALPAAGGQQALLGEERAGELGDDRVTLGGQGAGGGYQQQLQMARNLAEGEPQRAAQVVRGWVSADG